jgi:hypothetical protein
MRAFNADRLLQFVRLTFFSLGAFVHLFSLGMKFAVFRPLFLANGGANGMNGSVMIHRQWFDERGNPSSVKIVICVNQPLAGADGQGER